MRINRNNGNKSLQGLKTRTWTRPQGQGPDSQGQGPEICPYGVLKDKD